VVRNTYMKKTMLKYASLAFMLSTAVYAGPSYSPHKYQQNDWFGEFGENASMYVNPAGLAEADQKEAQIGIFRTISNEAGQEYFTLAVPIDYSHTFGASLFLNGATLDGGNNEPYVENSYMIGYAYRIIHHLAVGADLAVLQVNQFDIKKQFTVGLDVGLSWNPIANSKFGFLQLGVALQNALQPMISKSGDEGTEFLIQYANEGTSYAIPANLNLSAFWRGLNRMLEFKGEFSFIDVLHDKNEGGLDSPLQKMEYSFTATYYLNPMLGIKGRITKEGYFVAGATINIKDWSVFRYLRLDLELSHDDITLDSKNRGFIWASRITSRIGKTREEAIGEERYRRLKIEPERDYRRAMELYIARDFLAAAYAFGLVMTKYPAFHLVDQAAFFKGRSFENMRMHKAARETYIEASQKYSFSEQQANYLYRRMSIDYKEAKFNDALAKYQEITSKYADTDVKADADYIAGQIKFEQNQLAEVVRLLSPILPGNANYVYARYTLGITYSRQEDWDKAIAAFQDIIDYVPANQSERDIRDAAKVKLGHIYLSEEPPRLVEAANLYRDVPRQSYIYDEALIGVAWSMLKGRQAPRALEVAEAIIKSFPESYMIPEAYLIKGYSLYMMNRLQDSRRALEDCQKMTERSLVSQAQRDSALTTYKANEANFEKVQDRLKVLSGRLPTDRVQRQRSELRPDVIRAVDQIENYAQFLKKALDSDQYESNRTRILQDARFTLAIVMQKLGGSAAPRNDVDDLLIDDL
jgi:tetratricopeptide (TPR) repeat protein